HHLCPFFNDTAPTEIYPLSLHDALPLSREALDAARDRRGELSAAKARVQSRSEEHTSELQSLTKLVCRLLLEKNLASRGEHRLLRLLHVLVVGRGQSCDRYPKLRGVGKYSSGLAADQFQRVRIFLFLNVAAPRQ